VAWGGGGRVLGIEKRGKDACKLQKYYGKKKIDVAHVWSQGGGKKFGGGGGWGYQCPNKWEIKGPPPTFGWTEGGRGGFQEPI